MPISKDEYFAREVERIRPLKDYAFIKLGAEKFSDRQMTLLFQMARYDGKCGGDGCGIDFGGWTAFHTLLTGLIRKGVVKRVKEDYLLVEGSPLEFTEVMLTKPCMKIRREILDLYDGEGLAKTNAIIWLDPRGDANFYIILHPDLTGRFEGDPRTAKVDDILVAKGSSLEECVGRAKTLSYEFVKWTNSTIEEVILIKYETKAPENPDQWDMTGLLFQFQRLVLVGGQELFRRLEDGSLERYRSMSHLAGEMGSEACKKHLEEHNAVIIPYTPERVAALESIRARLASMALEFRRIVNMEDFAKLIETGGHLLLTAGHATVETTPIIQ